MVEHIDRSQPLGTHIVILDDNTTSFRFQDKTAKQGEYFALVGRADEMMTQHGTHCWSINPCSNFWGHMGEMPEFKLNLQLIYGACFGFIATHKEELDTKFGQVKDDVERSLRFHRMDGRTLRFMLYTLTKKKKGGTFAVDAGGISASLGSAAAWEQDCQRASARIVEEFGAYLTTKVATDGSTQVYFQGSPRVPMAVLPPKPVSTQGDLALEDVDGVLRQTLTGGKLLFCRLEMLRKVPGAFSNGNFVPVSAVSGFKTEWTTRTTVLHILGSKLQAPARKRLLGKAVCRPEGPLVRKAMMLLLKTKGKWTPAITKWAATARGSRRATSSQ